MSQDDMRNVGTSGHFAEFDRVSVIAEDRLVDGAGNQGLKCRPPAGLVDDDVGVRR